VPMSMGCYGIGITRIVGAAIEQNHDTKGIIWPEAISPFHVIIIPINLYKSNKVKRASEDLYSLMQKKNIEVLLDDRNVRPGVQFADAELIGIPHRVVISEKGIDNNNIEYRHRTSEDSKIITTEQLFDLLEKK